ncbi:MAG TPA: SdrD B-like domain-containing protein [Gemmatimonadales bacterium]
MKIARPLAALGVVTILVASCEPTRSSTSLGAPEYQLEGPLPRAGSGVATPENFQVCKSGSSTTFNYVIQDRTENPIQVTNGSVTENDGDCEIVAAVGSKGGIVNVTESMPAGFQLKDIIKVVVTGTSSGGTFTSLHYDTTIVPGPSVIDSFAGSSAPGGFRGVLVKYENIPLPPTGQIGDFVWSDLNGNGIQDAGEPGIGGQTVTLTGPVTASTTTNGSGQYLFTGLPAGSYTVTVGTPAGFTVTPSVQGTDTTSDSNGSPANVTLPAASSSNLTIDFGFVPIPPPPTGVIGDYVWLDLNGDGIQNVDESGIPGITVTLTGPVNATTTTDAAGGYLFSNLPLGTYQVSVTPPSGFSSSPANQGTDTEEDSNNNPSTVTLTVSAPVDYSIDFGFAPEQLACPAGSFSYAFSAGGDLLIKYDQFPAPNDNSYGVNAIGWTTGAHGHTFSDLVGSDHAGFQLVDGSGTVQLSFNADYISASSSAPSGYASLGVTGGDGSMLVGTASGITTTSSLANNLNNINIPGLFSASHVQQFGSVNVLVNSPPTDASHLTYLNSDPTLAGWDFHDTYYVTISASKLASIGFNASTWLVQPNLSQLHNSPAKACPGSTGGNPPPPPKPPKPPAHKNPPPPPPHQPPPPPGPKPPPPPPPHH